MLNSQGLKKSGMKLAQFRSSRKPAASNHILFKLIVTGIFCSEKHCGKGRSPGNKQGQPSEPLGFCVLFRQQLAQDRSSASSETRIAGLQATRHWALPRWSHDLSQPRTEARFHCGGGGVRWKPAGSLWCRITSCALPAKRCSAAMHSWHRNLLPAPDLRCGPRPKGFLRSELGGSRLRPRAAGTVPQLRRASICADNGAHSARVSAAGKITVFHSFPLHRFRTPTRVLPLEKPSGIYEPFYRFAFKNIFFYGTVFYKHLRYRGGHGVLTPNEEQG